MAQNHIMFRFAARATAALLVTLCCACDSESNMVGPEGGVVTSRDGRFTLEVPPGALDRDVEISVDVTQCHQPHTIGECYVLGPAGTNFLFPAAVAFELGDAELKKLEQFDDGHESDADAGSLGVIAESSEGWKMLADRNIDEHQDVVSASVLYLSTFALVQMDLDD